MDLYLYSIRNKTIKKVTPLNRGKTYDLTPLESKLVEVLSNGKENTRKEITEYVFGYYDRDTDYCLSTLKSRLLNKIKLHIKTIHDVGYKLNDIIYIE